MTDAVDILDYDLRHGIESDAYAGFDTEQWRVQEEPFRYTIRVQRITGDPSDFFYIDSREARCLAASLLRAADVDDAARNLSTRC